MNRDQRDWTPPTGEDAKLGMLDRIACGSLPARTTIDQTWLPFAPGTRVPLPEARGLTHDDTAALPFHMARLAAADSPAAWEFVAVAQNPMPAPGPISPDGRWVLSRDGIVQSLRTPGRVELRVADNDLALRVIGWRWGADSDHVLATAVGNQHRLICIHVPSGMVVWQLHENQLLSLPAGRSSHGSPMAIAAFRRLLVFNPVTGRVDRTLPCGFDGARVRLALSPDCSRILVSDRNVQVLDVSSGEVVAELERPSAQTDAAAISPCNRFALLIADFSASMHDIEHGGRALHYLRDQVLAVSDDMTWLALGNERGVVVSRLDLPAGPQPLFEFPGVAHRVPPTTFFSPDGSLLLHGSEVWSVPERRRLSASWHLPPARLVWIDETTVLTDTGTLFNADTARAVGERPQIATLRDHLAATPDGRIVAAATDEHLVVLESANGRVLFERVLPEFESGAETRCPLALSQDGKVVAYADRVMRLDGSRVVMLQPEPHRDEAWPHIAAFSPDGTQLAMHGQRLLVFDTASGRQVLGVPLRAPDMANSGLAVGFSPGGREVAVAFRDESVSWHRIATGRSLQKAPCPPARAVPTVPDDFLRHTRQSFSAIACSPDRRRLAVIAEGVLCFFRAR